jgi:hypothetical protein
MIPPKISFVTILKGVNMTTVPHFMSVDLLSFRSLMLRSIYSEWRIAVHFMI